MAFLAENSCRGTGADAADDDFAHTTMCHEKLDLRAQGLLGFFAPQNRRVSLPDVQLTLGIISVFSGNSVGLKLPILIPLFLTHPPRLPSRTAQ
jgi:hypothetical protein